MLNSGFPFTYEDIVFSSFLDIYKYFHMSPTTGIKLKKESGIEENNPLEFLIWIKENWNPRNKVSDLEKEFPRYVGGEFLTFNKFIEKYNLDKKSVRHYYSRALRDGCSTDRFINFFHKGYSRRVIYPQDYFLEPVISKSTCFWVQGKLFVASLSDAESKFGTPKSIITRFQTCSEDNESGFISAYIEHRIKSNQNVAKGVKAEELLWESNGEKYYRYTIDGDETEYLSSSEIIERRIGYASIGEETDGVGTYSSWKELCEFYNFSETLAEDFLEYTLNGADKIIERIIEGSKLFKMKRSISTSTQKRIREGEISLKRHVEYTQHQQGSPIEVQIPIFRGKEITGYERKKFASRKKARNFFHCSGCKRDGSPMTDDEFRHWVIDSAVFKQNRKKFVFGLEFESKSDMMRCLKISDSFNKQLQNKSDDETEKVLLEEYFGSNLSPDGLNKRLSVDWVEILHWSFCESKSNINYFACRITRDGAKRIKVMSSKELILLKVQDYKEREGILQ